MTRSSRSGYIQSRKAVYVNRTSFSLYTIFGKLVYRYNNWYDKVKLSCTCEFREYTQGIEHILCKTHQEALQKCEKCKWISITDDLEFTHLQLR